jgi:Ca2+-binding EF-hand superfamily protein
VTADEFEKLIKELGFPPNPEVIQQVFAEADTNDDGGISFKEFLSSIYLWSIVSELQTATGEKIELIDAVKAVHRAFDFFDLDHSGYIDCDEFKRTMTMLDSPMTDEQKEEAYARVDGNGNGLITFKEYLGEIAEALGKTV